MSILKSDGKQLEVELVDSVRKAVASWDMPEHSITLRDKNSLWKVSSALQKSVRRGYTALAVKYTQALFNGGQAEYFWRRLSVIAMEDIGPANRWLCAQCIAMSRKVEYRKSNPMKIACWLVKELSESKKSRSYTDVTCTTSFRAHKNLQLLKIARELVPSQQVNLLQVNPTHFEDFEKVVIDQAFLARRMMGDREWERETGNEFTPREPARSMFWEAMDAMLDPLSMYLLYAGQKKGVHDLNNVVVPLFHVLGPEYEVEVQQNDVPEPLMIGGVIEQAFDWHTQEGKRCLGYFAKAYAPITEFMADAGVKDPTSVLGILLFQTESGLLSNIMRHPKLDQLLAMGDKSDYIQVGLSVGGGEKLRAIMESPEAREALRQVRLRVVGNYKALEAYLAESSVQKLI